ncbi:hypothetical protein [Klebsiella sp. CN_Kp116]|uniref:hypothetical protein n=1 Tax=unclassified Klebsiella TaxID=2608929 RepID=UPI0032B3FE71
MSKNTPQDAIAYINTKIDTVEQLIQLLSPEKYELLIKHRLFSNARRINSLSEITRFRTTGNAQWLGSFGDVTSAFLHAKGNNSPVLCKLGPGGEPFIIIPQ